MPELPEVETIRRQLDPALRHRTILGGGAHPSPKFAPATHAIGATIDGVRRRGKYLLVDLDDGRELIVHLGMTGRFGFRPGTEPDRSPYLRAWWDLGDRVLEFHDTRRFGRIAVVLAGDHGSLPTLAALGPEPLSSEFTPERLWAAMRTRTARVKTQLLSQRPVAGVGNIYADEALWQAGIDPAARRVSRPAAARLHAALVAVLQAGVDNGGTTLRDYRTVAGEIGSNQLHLQCYGRAGQPCLRCDGTLSRKVLDGRSTTWCRTCQTR